MSSIFSQHKDSSLDDIEFKVKNDLKFPLPKTSNIINNYTRGDFIVIGGRKTSGKSSYILNNYVVSPLIQKLMANKSNKEVKLRVVYLNNRKSIKSMMDRMAVNYGSNKKNGSKVGVPSMYRFKGDHIKLTIAEAKDCLNVPFLSFDRLIERGILSIYNGNKTISEVDNIINITMEEYGEINNETNKFVYKEEFKGINILVSIDDITGIIGPDGSNCFRNNNSNKLAIKLRYLSKFFNITIILGVPSITTYRNVKSFKNNNEEISPYHIYADRALILHNPLETDEINFLGYTVADFINNDTGNCYLRSAYVSCNYMGASGLYIPYFMYPENGYFMELPKPDYINMVQVFTDLVLTIRSKEETESKQNEEQDLEKELGLEQIEIKLHKYEEE